jgi:hypothetical protein
MRIVSAAETEMCYVVIWIRTSDVKQQNLERQTEIQFFVSRPTRNNNLEHELIFSRRFISIRKLRVFCENNVFPKSPVTT